MLTVKKPTAEVRCWAQCTKYCYMGLGYGTAPISFKNIYTNEAQSSIYFLSWVSLNNGSSKDSDSWNAVLPPFHGHFGPCILKSNFTKKPPKKTYHSSFLEL